MAVTLLFRAAIVLAPIGWRLVQQAQGPGLARWDEKWNRRLADPDEADETLSAELSAETGTMTVVTTFPGPFSLRKLHMVWGRSSGAAVPDDDALCTFHFLKVTGGNPADTWVDADFTTIEAAWDTCWNYLRPRWSDSMHLKQYRWYRAGPDQEALMGGQGRTGPPVRVVDRSVYGGDDGILQLPPQVALTVTERTTVPRSWGRFYMPAPQAASSAWNNVDPEGRWVLAFQQTVADAWEDAYAAAKAAGTPVVVYSRAKAERPSKGGGTLPAIGARALTVDELQVDDLADVIRSRRWGTTLRRERRTI